MKISIFGLGYVGAVSLACLARDGHQVIGVDIDATKLRLITEGKTPVVEEGMVELMQQVAASGRLSVTTDAAEAVLGSEISLVCVGTPSAANGSQDQGAIVRLAAQMGKALARKQANMGAAHVVVFRSTLVPGTVEDVLRPIVERESGKKDGVDFHLCFQPEFLREGSSIKDYDKPPFTIVGANGEPAHDKLQALFGHLPCKYLRTSVRAAEMMKYTCNNFHALKITFANETARLCAALGVDPFEVMDLVCQDTQLNISKAYLKPGFAFGGSCLPKDLRATAYLAKTRDVAIPMLASILASNQDHLDLAFDKVVAAGKRKVGFVGLSFKTGTDDLRESPLVTLAEKLIGKGYELRIYDPEVHLARLLGANKSFIEQHLPHIGQMLHAEIDSVVAESDLIVLGSSSRVVIDALAARLKPGQAVVDLVHVHAGALPAGQGAGPVLVTLTLHEAAQFEAGQSVSVMAEPEPREAALLGNGWPRICIVGPLPPPSGGMANQCAQLLRLLRAEGASVELVRTNAPYRPAWAARLPGLRAGFRALPYLWHLWRALGRAEVVHVFANSGWAWHLLAAPALWVARRRGVPAIVNYRGGLADSFFSRGPRHVLRALEQAALRVTPSEFLVQVFARHGLNAEVVPNIVDLSKFRARAARTPDVAPHLVVTRNLEPIYDIPTAMQAFALVRKVQTQARLTVAGSGPELPALQQLAAELGLSDAVTFSGRIDNERISELYADADVVLNPSTADNMPISILEALACGVPVVSTNAGGIPDLVRHEETALLVNVGDAAAMAAAALRVLRDATTANRLRDAGMQMVPRFAWPNVRESWRQAYRRAIASHPNKRKETPR